MPSSLQAGVAAGAVGPGLQGCPGRQPQRDRVDEDGDGAERRQQILDAARAIAEADGWAAVTSRRLADAIGYTQPVLYQHFPGGKSEIMRTVALGWFTELAAATEAARGRKQGARAVAAVAGAYLDFAGGHPALYEAMFQLPIDARFAQRTPRPS